ncbi:MAG TPA: dephospho-CoA kinase [Thiolapillus brandeum]|uniref:Dephospho-CoA kinase n=1 Tax=Thiolapillus brandeum TaxID=1076588 RepID=A0A831RYQ2_9GAMM|nr:dephospho-CoA kinase [Thiolapillus brandeum]
MNQPLRIGLTGGIGSGKSAASHEFARLGVPVIDTDVIARELVCPGQPALAEIVAQFGDGILDENAGLDRSRLRQTVFSDPAARRQLEAILHPRIRTRADALARDAEGPYCVLVIPLLLESGDDYALDRILVIDVPVELQRRRIAARDGLPDNEVEAILAAQADRAQRLAIADDVIVNDRSHEHLCREIERLHHLYRAAGRPHKA